MATDWIPERGDQEVGEGNPNRIPVDWLLLLGVILFAPLVEGGTTHAAVTVIRLAVLVGLGWAWMKACRAGSITVPVPPVAPAVWLFLGLAFVSAWTSPYRHQSLQWVFVLFTYTGLLYLLVSALTAWEHVRRILIVVVVLVTAEAALGIGQYLWGGALRPTGTFFNPNFLAGYLAAGASFVMGLVCLQMVRRVPAFWAVGSCVVLLLVSAIVMTGSRGAMLALGGGITVVLLSRFRMRGAMALGIMVLCLWLVPNPLTDRLRAEHQVNALSYARIRMWGGAVQDMIAHPTGVGLGLYQYVYPLHPVGIEGQITRYGRTAQNAHNEFLQIGVELGILGLLTFLWGIVWLGREAVLLLRTRLGRLHRGVLLGAAGAVTTMLIHAGVDGTLHEPALAVLLTVFAALLLSANQWADGRSRQPAAWTFAFPNHRLAVGAAGIGFLCMVVTSVAGIGVAWSAHEAGAQAADRQDYARAIAGYERAIAWDPGKALYHSSLGAAHYQTFLRTGQWSEAERSLTAVKTAMALNPLDGRLWGLLGNLYLTMANTASTAWKSSGEEKLGPPVDRSVWQKAAITAYEAALQREPYNPFYRLELARLRAREREFTEAEAMLRELLALEPNFLPGRALLAEVFVTQGRDQAARDVYRDIVARQQQFAHWTKDPLEQRYLDVDANRLSAIVTREVARL